MYRLLLACVGLVAATFVLAGCGLLFPPRLTVAPTNSVIDLARGPSTTFVVANEGASGSVLRWSFTGSQLTATPPSGELPGGRSIAVTVVAPTAEEGQTLTGQFEAGSQVVEVTVGLILCGPVTSLATTVDGRARLLVGFGSPGIGAAAEGIDLSATAASAVAAFGGVLARRGTRGGFDVIEIGADRLDAAAQALRALPWVRYAVPDVQISRSDAPLDARYDGQWNLSSFGAEPTWEVLDALAVQPGTIVVAVVDDGVFVDHADFAGRLLPGYDVHDFDTDVRNGTDHGTHVAGIVGAARDAIGIAGVASVPWVRILPVKAWPDTTSPTQTTSLIAILDGMRWAAGLPVGQEGDAPVNPNPADVVNMSLGTASAATNAAFADQIARLHELGIVVVAASGNTSDPALAGCGLDYPAASGALSVGSVDADFERSSFSKYGPGLDLTAPGGFGPNPYCSGGAIVSTGLEFIGAEPVEAWTCKAGTSMATPFVSGAAALLLGVDAQLRSSPNRVPLVEERIRAAAARTPGSTTVQYGSGVLCLDALLTATHVCGESIAP